MSGAVDGPVRRLDLADLDSCVRLAKDRGWPPEERKWRFLFEVGEVYGVDAPDGDGLAATTILTRYAGVPGLPHGLAAVSMVLVASRHGRQGLGSRIVADVLGRAGEATATLYATATGRPVYERLGFTAVQDCTTYRGPFTAPPTTEPASRPATPADRAAIAKLDARAAGADRSRVLDALPDLAERIRVVERAGRLTAYAGAWRNDETLMVGPVVAEDDAAARAVIADVCRGDEGRVRLDLAHDSQLHGWARERGLPVAAETTIMVRGRQALPGDARLRVLPVMQALG